MGVFWPLYSWCPSFCKICWCLLWTSYSGYTGFPFFFVSSDSLGFGLHFLLHCLCQLYKFSGIYHSIFSYSRWVFHYQSLFKFQLLLINLFSNCLSVSEILIFQKFSFLLFLLLLLGRFTVCVVIVAASYIKVFISVMSNSTSSQSSSIIPFTSPLSFTNLLFSFSFDSLFLSDICSSLTLCHIMWRSSFSLIPNCVLLSCSWVFIILYFT